MNNLKVTIKQQNKLLVSLQGITDQLNVVKEKSKSQQVRDAISAVVDAVEAIEYNKNNIHGAFYDAEKTAIRATTEAKHIAPPPVQNVASNGKQETILKVCEELKASLAKQQEDINQLKRSQTQPPLHTPSRQKHNQLRLGIHPTT